MFWNYFERDVVELQELRLEEETKQNPAVGPLFRDVNFTLLLNDSFTTEAAEMLVYLHPMIVIRRHETFLVVGNKRVFQIAS